MKTFVEATVKTSHRATIQEVVVYFHDDNVANDIEVSLQETTCAVNSSNIPGLIKTRFGVGHKVDLSNNYYKLKFTSLEDDGGQLLGLYSVIVLYATDFAE